MPQVTQSASNVEGSGVSGKLGLPQSVTVHSLSDQGMTTSSQGGQAPKGKLPDLKGKWTTNVRAGKRMQEYTEKCILRICWAFGQGREIHTVRVVASHKEGERVESRGGL